MSKPLTSDLILQKTKASNLESVKNLNLWGNEIDDVRIVREMPNLEVLSLSVNKIDSLKPFQHCKKLSELYLRKNLIQDLTELRYLQGLPGLKVLWLWDNPCAEHPKYRETVLSYLPNLVKLDNQAVSGEEKNALKPEVPKNRPATSDESSRGLAQERPRANRVKREVPVNKNENLVAALLALIKELDEAKLEIVKREIERRIGERFN
jgi:Leucine-rich repeat (LRR) protein